MAQVKLAIYKTPIQAEKLGKKITKTVTITDTEARKIRNYYNSVDEGAGEMFNTFVGVMVGIATRNVKLAFALSSGAAAGLITNQIFKTYYSQLADKFDMLLDGNPNKCKVTYTYKRHSSNDGAYWLTDLKVL